MNIVWENLKFFVTCLKNLPVSKNLILENNKGFCVSTGCDFESWVFYPEKINSYEVVEDVIKFFQDNKISFVWPLYDDGEKFLERAGLIYAGDLTAMSFEPGKNSYNGHDEKILIKRCNDHKIFAQTVWQGFNGEINEIPEKYFAFIEALNNYTKNFSLYIAEYENQNVGTFLITHGENLTGVYYFATLPKFRRKGVARAMMKKICELSIGKKIVLQATPSGLNFYKNFGFEKLFNIPVYSNETDVF